MKWTEEAYANTSFIQACAKGRSKDLIDFLDEENGEMLKKDSEIQEVLSFPMNLEIFCGRLDWSPISISVKEVLEATLLGRDPHRCFWF